MATPRQRYSRIPHGLVESYIAKVSWEAALVAMWLITCPARRSVPGCVRMGVAGLAEAMGKPTSKMRCWLVELERAGFVTTHQANRVIYVRGAVASDGPRTVQTVKAFFADWAELPECAIKTEIQQDITAALAEADDALRNTWADLLKSCGKTYVKTDAETHPKSLPSPIPVPIPVPTPQPQPSPSPCSKTDSVSRIRAALARLPQPPFAAAAEGLAERLLAEHGLEKAGVLIEKLGSSCWVSGNGKIPPKLEKLLDAKFSDALFRGEYAGRERWRCAHCGCDHRAVDDCPPVCRGCQRQHPVTQHCAQLEAMELREQRAEEERVEAERLKQEAAAAGVTVAELQAQRREEYRRTHPPGWLKNQLKEARVRFDPDPIGRATLPEDAA